MAEHVFVGFGFGPIQGGLFAKEAFQSGNFSRIVVVEIDRQLVGAVRANKGTYYVNVAKSDGVEVLKIEDVELLDPTVPRDRAGLLNALTQATEIATCLPSVKFYDTDRPNSVASLIAEGLRSGSACRIAPATIVYAAENDIRAAELLEEAVAEKFGAIRGQTRLGASSGRRPLPEHGGPSRSRTVQFLNTVIGKMSRVVNDPAEIAERQLVTIAPDVERAFLVEEFNRILVSRTTITGFRPGIEVFVEKADLLPFEEAKLYGHNAIHSLLGFIGTLKGYKKMMELQTDDVLMDVGRCAFLEESGAALVRKYSSRLGRDELFTEAGYRSYAEDLLGRMTNPYLADTVSRTSRDVVRKLGMNERIFGTMKLALEYDIEPKNMALGAIAGVAVLVGSGEENNLPSDLRLRDWRQLDSVAVERILDWIWGGRRLGGAGLCPAGVGRKGKYARELVEYTQNAMEGLIALTG